MSLEPVTLPFTKIHFFFYKKVSTYDVHFNIYKEMRCHLSYNSLAANMLHCLYIPIS